MGSLIVRLLRQWNGIANGDNDEIIGLFFSHDGASKRVLWNNSKKMAFFSERVFSCFFRNCYLQYRNLSGSHNRNLSVPVIRMPSGVSEESFKELHENLYLAFLEYPSI